MAFHTTVEFKNLVKSKDYENIVSILKRHLQEADLEDSEIAACNLYIALALVAIKAEIDSTAVDKDEIISRFNNALDKCDERERPQYNYQYADALFRMGDFDEAEKKIKTAMQSEPDNTDYCYLYGLIERKRHNVENSLFFLRKGLMLLDEKDISKTRTKEDFIKAIDAVYIEDKERDIEVLKVKHQKDLDDLAKKFNKLEQEKMAISEIIDVKGISKLYNGNINESEQRLGGLRKLSKGLNERLPWKVVLVVGGGIIASIIIEVLPLETKALYQIQIIFAVLTITSVLLYRVRHINSQAKQELVIREDLKRKHIMMLYASITKDTIDPEAKIAVIKHFNYRGTPEQIRLIDTKIDEDSLLKKLEKRIAKIVTNTPS